MHLPGRLQNMGDGYQVFIDADNNASTGYGINGADYFIENGTFFPYNGSNGSTSWNWNFNDAVTIIDNSENTTQVRELKVDRDLFTHTPLNTTINISLLLSRVNL